MSVDSISRRLAELEIELPEVPMPIGNFVPYRIEGRFLFLSGQGPLMEDGTLAKGKVGYDVDTTLAYQHARRTGMVLLSVMRDAIGDLSRIANIVKLFGMVNAALDFSEHPEVINGCSDLFAEIFGHDSLHARSAVGVGSLPRGITVEIEAIAILKC